MIIYGTFNGQDNRSVFGICCQGPYGLHKFMSICIAPLIPSKTFVSLVSYIYVCIFLLINLLCHVWTASKSGLYNCTKTWEVIYISWCVISNNISCPWDKIVVYQIINTSSLLLHITLIMCSWFTLEELKLLGVEVTVKFSRSTIQWFVSLFCRFVFPTFSLTTSYIT